MSWLGSIEEIAKSDDPESLENLEKVAFWFGQADGRNAMKGIELPEIDTNDDFLIYFASLYALSTKTIMNLTRCTLSLNDLRGYWEAGVAEEFGVDQETD